MRHEYSDQNRKCVCFLEGRITMENAPALEKEFLEVLKSYPDCELIIDAQDLVYISSAGLRVFLKLIKRSTKKNFDSECIGFSLFNT